MNKQHKNYNMSSKLIDPNITDTRMFKCMNQDRIFTEGEEELKELRKIIFEKTMYIRKMLKSIQIKEKELNLFKASIRQEETEVQTLEKEYRLKDRIHQQRKIRGKTEE